MSLTDVLNREIQDAHRSLLEPSPGRLTSTGSPLIASQHHTSDTFLTARNKSRRAATSIEKPKEPRITRTYASQEDRRSRSSRHVLEFQVGSDGELDGVPRRDENYSGMGDADLGKTSGRGSFKSISRSIIDGSPVDHNMPPPDLKSLSKQIKYNESNESPTIADSTPIQASHPFTTPVRSPLEDDAKFFHAACSDGCTPTPKVPSNSRSTEIGLFKETQIDGDTERLFGAGLEDPIIGPDILQEPSSSVSMLLSSKVITVKEVNSDSAKSCNIDGVRPDEKLIKPPIFQAAGSTNPIVLLPDHQLDAQSFDELSLPAPNHDKEEHLLMPKNRKRKRQKDEQADELNSDDSSIGLPKEQYQARPSRSRGSRNNEDLVMPTDYSKRPEAKTNTKKSRRHKTTAFVELIPKEDEDAEGEESKSICQNSPDLEIPAFTKKEDEDGKPYKNGMVAVEDCKTRSEALEKNPSPKKQRGRPKKDSNSKALRDLIEDSIGVESENGSPLKATDTARAAKRGRPNKKSLAVVVEGSDSEDIDLLAPAGTSPAEASKRSIKALDETSGNSSLPKLTEKSYDPPPTPSKTSPPPVTPQKSATNNTKGPDKHSPISGGKVPYRVGLSKRARIAPLLRMVRK